LSLFDGETSFNAEIIIDNNVCDHRLRAYINTGTNVKTVWSENHFDIMERPAELKQPKPEVMVESAPTEFPNKRFVAAFDGKKGLAVVTHGIQEHQYLPKENGAIALTLFRSVGWLSRPNLLRRLNNAGPEKLAVGSQILGVHKFKLNIALCKNEKQLPKIQEFSAKMNAKPSLWFGNISDNKLKNLLLYSIKGAAVSALKISEDKKGIIFRLWNGMNYTTQAEVSIPSIKIKKAWQVRLDEQKIKTNELNWNSNGFNLKIPAKKIATIYVETIFTNK